MSIISLFRKLFGQNTSITSIGRERPTPRQIGLFGYFGIGNFGNDGSLEAMLRLLREARPEAELLCICGSPSEVEPRLNVHSVRINWRPGNKLFQKVDRFLLNIPREIASLIKTALRRIHF